MRREQYLSTLPLTIEHIHLFGSDVRPVILPRDLSSLFADFLGVLRTQLELVYIGPDPREIRINKPPVSAQGGRQICTAFADSAPYLLATEESLDDVNGRLLDGEAANVKRFRPNIVVAGTGRAWDEDNWHEIVIGGAGRFFVVARCPRCQIPKFSYINGLPNSSVDPRTGINDPEKRIYRTLGTFRRIDAGRRNTPCFGMLCVSDNIGKVTGKYVLNVDGFVNIGDAVKVERRGEHYFTK